jgi:hypothetical protein
MLDAYQAKRMMVGSIPTTVSSHSLSLFYSFGHVRHECRIKPFGRRALLPKDQKAIRPYRITVSKPLCLSLLTAVARRRLRTSLF